MCRLREFREVAPAIAKEMRSTGKLGTRPVLLGKVNTRWHNVVTHCRRIPREEEARPR